MNSPTRAQLLSYSLPNIAVALLFTPATAFLPNVYAKETAISLGAIGAVLVGLRIFDAVLDQVVGFLSDRTRTRWGARLPWIIAGAPLFMVSSWFLYTPPASAGVVYFGGWSFVFYVAYTMLNIPYMAWGAELAPDYQGRATVFTWYGVSSQVGGFLFFSAPLILVWLGLSKSSEFGGEQLHVVMLLGILLLPFVLWLLYRNVPRRDEPAEKRPTIAGALEALRRNRPLQLYILAFSISITGTGAFAACAVILLDSHLHLGAQMPILFIVMSVIGIVMAYPVRKIVLRFGKHRPWAVTWTLSALTLPLLALVDPAGAHVFEWTLAVLVLYAVVDALTNLVPFAVLADVVDYERLRSGEDRAGNFYAFANLMIKAMAALGGGVGYLILEWCHYDVKTPSANGTDAIAGLMFAALFLPSVLKISGALIVWHFPIDARRAEIVRRGLERRARRSPEALDQGRLPPKVTSNPAAQRLT
jgi:glycoside/pentoside/hexuronide:cation symporter, GPH family